LKNDERRFVQTRTGSLMSYGADIAHRPHSFAPLAQTVE
jgi:hypothetical protein